MKKYTKQQLKRAEELEKRAEEMIKHWNSMVDNFHVDNQTEIPVHENKKWR